MGQTNVRTQANEWMIWGPNSKTDDMTNETLVLNAAIIQWVKSFLHWWGDRTKQSGKFVNGWEMVARENDMIDAQWLNWSLLFRN